MYSVCQQKRFANRSYKAEQRTPCSAAINKTTHPKVSISVVNEAYQILVSYLNIIIDSLGFYM